MAEAFGIGRHELVSFHFRCGSKPDVGGMCPLRPLLGVKQTKTASKRTLDGRGEYEPTESLRR